VAFARVDDARVEIVDAVFCGGEPGDEVGFEGAGDGGNGNDGAYRFPSVICENIFITNVRFPAATARNPLFECPFSEYAGPPKVQEQKMRLSKLVFAGTAALIVGAMPASAAPTVGAQLKTTAAENSAVDNVNYRRCWRGYDGLRRCRYVRYYYPYYDDGYYGYGYGPSVGLYFGGGRFGGHRGHWGGHRR
jgi:hypothetical protein